MSLKRLIEAKSLFEILPCLNLRYGWEFFKERETFRNIHSGEIKGTEPKVRVEAAALSNQPAEKGKHAQQYRGETIFSPKKDVYSFTKLFLHEKVMGNFRFSYGNEKSCRTLFK